MVDAGRAARPASPDRVSIDAMAEVVVQIMEHRHVSFTPAKGMLVALRVEHHSGAEGADIGGCGLCGSLVWVMPKTERYRAMRPWTPMLCCLCAQISTDVLSKAIPDLDLMQSDVPDLTPLLN